MTSTVKVPSLLQVVPLLCLPSRHTFDTVYQWHLHESSSEPYANSPVVYAKQPGIYTCTVTDGKDVIVSSPITVEIDFGMLTNQCYRSRCYIGNLITPVNCFYVQDIPPRPIEIQSDSSGSDTEHTVIGAVASLGTGGKGKNSETSM